MDSKTIVKLTEALKQGQLPEAQPWNVGAAVCSIADALARPGSPISVSEVRAAAQILNRRRHFDHTRMLGQAWSDCRGFDPTIVKHQAQALINLSALDAAEQLLQDGLARITAPGASAQAVAERLEYEGLLGRIDKQRFVATADKDSLVKATDRYLAQYEGDASKPYWHGINAVALRAREEREGLYRPAVASVIPLAKAIYKQVIQLYRDNPGDPWLASTASEACLALSDKCDQAELWLYRFLHHPNVQPFDVESYDRQIREIWQGTVSGGGSACADRLAAIMVRHIARTQLRWSLSALAVPAMVQAIERDPDAFEKNFLGEASFSVDMVKRMLDACSSIGCVINTRGERLGTGFLIRGAWLKDSFNASPVFVTNAHVISDAVPNAISPTDTLVQFEVESASAGAPIFYKVSEVLFTSAPGDLGVCCTGYDNLDVTIVRLEGLNDRFAGLPTADVLPLIDAKAKAYVVGHPRGSGLQISLHDSLLLDIDDDERLVHYRTPTDPGSSGSPVFNAQWEVIAVHHGGSNTTPRLHGKGNYEANEGIALSAARRKLRM